MLHLDWNQTILWGNTPKDYAIALGIIIVGMIVLQVLKVIIDHQALKFSQRSKVNIYPGIRKTWKTGILPLLYFLLILNAVLTLNMHHSLTKTLRISIGVIFVFYVARILILILKIFLDYHFTKQGRGQEKNALNGVVLLVYIFLWVVGIVFILANLGYDVRTVLAGLGIGGIAIALGAQNIIMDIIAYFSILFDNPFAVGDYIAVNSNEGTVTQIGIKTTRIQSLSGEELIYSNRNILDQWIHNYGRMPKRRGYFSFNLSYDTPVKKLKLIPEKIQNIIAEQDKIAVDSVRFTKFNDYGLLFQATFYSLEPGYQQFIDKQQNINLKICELFQEMDVRFAISADRKVRIDETQTQI